MKTLCILTAALLPLFSVADEIKLKTGATVPGKVTRLIPAVVEITGARGVTTIPWLDLDQDWRIATFPKAQETVTLLTIRSHREQLKEIKETQAKLMEQLDPLAKENAELKKQLDYQKDAGELAQRDKRLIRVEGERDESPLVTKLRLVMP